MKLPSLLPEDLSYTSAAPNGRALYESLLKNPDDFSRFIASSAIDETWCRQHSAFIKLSLQWFTNQFFEDRLPVNLAKRVAKAIREHYHIFGRWTPKNLTVEIKGGQSFPVSSLLMGTSSEWLRQRIRYYCRDQRSTTLVFESITPEMFLILEEYVEKAHIHALWSKNQDELHDILIHASDWRLTSLVDECQELQLKYIDETNVVKVLLQAHEEKWPIIRHKAMEVINQSDLGIRLEESSIDQFHFEFIDFRKTARDLFDSLYQVITFLGFRFRLNEDPLFSKSVHRCPRLNTLCVSETVAFSDRMLDLPSRLEGLDLSKCSWLNHKNLRQILENCSSLVSLALRSNVQLNYIAWGLLKRIKGLERLDLSGCHQVNDQDLKVILQAGKGLTHLSLERCTGLSDLSFFEISKYSPQIVDLNLSYCTVYDAALIDIATRCSRIIHLNLKWCKTLTDRGVLEVIRIAPNLKSIEISGSGLSNRLVTEIKKLRPYLNLN